MIVAYPQPNKTRSLRVLSNFVVGAGGTLAPGRDFVSGAESAFFGVQGIEEIFAAARASGRDWYYGDNSFFDQYRKKLFRMWRNDFQLARLAKPDWERAKRLAIVPRRWQRNGRHIVVVQQSDHFMNLVGQAPGWLERTIAELRCYTDRPISARLWRRSKMKAQDRLQPRLQGAWALVTHTSAAANEALLAGVPAFVTGPCAASPLASGPLSAIERPIRPEGREEWIAGLCGLMWTYEEMWGGLAWRRLAEEL